MDPKIHSNTGNAPIKKQGQTSSGQHGSDPFMKAKGRRSEPTPLTIK